MPAIVINKTSKKRVIDEINKWEGKLTWSLLCKYITLALELDKEISRHTLLNYPEIKDAFDNKKEQLKNINLNTSTGQVDLDAALKEINRLNSEVSRLNKQNTALKERHVTWLKNIYMMKGVDVSSIDSSAAEVKKRINEINAKLQRPLYKLDRKGN